MTTAQKERLGRNFSRIAAKWERRFSRAAGKRFRAERDALLAVLEEVAGRKQAVEWHNVERGWKQVFEEAGEEWRSAFVPLLEGTITEQSKAQAIALGMQFDISNVYAEVHFDDYVMAFANNVIGQSERELAGLLQQAQREGWSIPQTQQRIGLLFEQWLKGDLTVEAFEWFEQRMPAWRRALISRTEVIKSSNVGINALYKQWGITEKQWWATPDDRACDWCLAMHKTIVGIDMNFWEQNQTMTVEVDGKPKTMTFNYEAIKTPPLHPNCRCTIVSVLK